MISTLWQSTTVSAGFSGRFVGGTVAERTNAPALKADESKGSGGSNPPRSARCSGAVARRNITTRWGLSPRGFRRVPHWRWVVARALHTVLAPCHVGCAKFTRSGHAHRASMPA